MMNIPREITHADVDELAAFLDSDRTPEGCIDICALDGFLTCLAIGPETIPPSRWLPFVWDEEEGSQMEWESMDEANHILGLLMGYFNSIIADFQHDPPTFSPLVYQNRAGEPILEDWCFGFMVGVRLSPKPWDQLALDPEMEDAFGVIAIHGTPEGWKALEKEKNRKISQERWLEILTDSVLLIHEYWIPHRLKSVQTMASDPFARVGRNDPCPCGSGKKFKHCCMH